MAEHPKMPLWTDAYLADTTHLSTIEHGAYLLLLMAMWRAKDKRLPADDRSLAKFARLTPGQWTRIKPTIMAFFDAEDGFVSQGRLTDEAVAVRQFSKSQSDKAKARHRKTKANAPAPAEPKRSPEDAPFPYPFPIGSEPKGSSPKITPFSDFWSVWPSKVAKSAAEAAWKKLPDADRGAAIASADAWFRCWRSRNQQASPIHASTYLNQKRWQDEASEAVTLFPSRGPTYGQRSHDVFAQLEANLTQRPFRS